jgi:hypothetical protein
VRPDYAQQAPARLSVVQLAQTPRPFAVQAAHAALGKHCAQQAQTKQFISPSKARSSGTNFGIMATLLGQRAITSQRTLIQR